MSMTVWQQMILEWAGHARHHRWSLCESFFISPCYLTLLSLSCKMRLVFCSMGVYNGVTFGSISMWSSFCNRPSPVNTCVYFWMSSSFNSGDIFVHTIWSLSSGVVSSCSFFAIMTTLISPNFVRIQNPVILADLFPLHRVLALDKHLTWISHSILQFLVLWDYLLSS